jgi:integrase/recombinase XerD
MKLENHLLIDRFLEALVGERGVARNTLLSYREDLKNFYDGLGEKHLHEVTPQDVSSYIQKLAQEQKAATTQARHISALRQFYKFLMSEGIIEANPMALLAPPKIPRSLPKILTYADIEKLLTTAAQDTTPKGVRMQALMELLYASGLRVSELVSLPYAILAADAEVLRKRRFIFIKGKGGKERLVPLSDLAIESLTHYLKIRPVFLEGLPKTAEQWLFPSRSKEGHLTRLRFYQLIKDLAVIAGLSPAKVSPHVIRHAFATHLLHGGADLLSIQKLLGHSDISTTQIYTHVMVDHIVNMVNQHHPLAKKIK